MQKNIGVLYQRQYKCTVTVTQKDTVLLKCSEGKSFSLVPGSCFHKSNGVYYT